MPKIDRGQVPFVESSGYPDNLKSLVAGRAYQRLTVAGGLTQFGANIVRLSPGAASSLRHWHEKEDEFVLVLDGTLTLVEDDGSTVLHPGDCAAFPAGVQNGHHLINRSEEVAHFLVVGTRAQAERAHYSEHDLLYERDEAGARFTRRDGTAFGEE